MGSKCTLLIFLWCFGAVWLEKHRSHIYSSPILGYSIHSQRIWKELNGTLEGTLREEFRGAYFKELGLLGRPLSQVRPGEAGNRHSKFHLGQKWTIETCAKLELSCDILSLHVLNVFALPVCSRRQFANLCGMRNAQNGVCALDSVLCVLTPDDEKRR